MTHFVKSRRKKNTLKPKLSIKELSSQDYRKCIVEQQFIGRNRSLWFSQFSGAANEANFSETTIYKYMETLLYYFRYVQYWSRNVHVVNGKKMIILNCYILIMI